jgi:hypothetical protein
MTTASHVKNKKGESALLQPEGPLKKDALQFTPIRLMKVVSKRPSQFGKGDSFQLAFNYLTDGQAGEYGEVWWEGLKAEELERHFVVSRNEPVDGQFVKNPVINGTLVRGWQFVDPDIAFEFDAEGNPTATIEDRTLPF